MKCIVFVVALVLLAAQASKTDDLSPESETSSETPAETPAETPSNTDHTPSHMHADTPTDMPADTLTGAPTNVHDMSKEQTEPESLCEDVDDERIREATNGIILSCKNVAEDNMCGQLPLDPFVTLCPSACCALSMCPGDCVAQHSGPWAAESSTQPEATLIHVDTSHESEADPNNDMPPPDPTDADPESKTEPSSDATDLLGGGYHLDGGVYHPYWYWCHAYQHSNGWWYDWRYVVIDSCNSECGCMSTYEDTWQWQTRTYCHHYHNTGQQGWVRVRTRRLDTPMDATCLNCNIFGSFMSSLKTGTSGIKCCKKGHNSDNEDVGGDHYTAIGFSSLPKDEMVACSNAVCLCCGYDSSFCNGISSIAATVVDAWNTVGEVLEKVVQPLAPVGEAVEAAFSPITTAFSSLFEEDLSTQAQALLLLEHLSQRRMNTTKGDHLQQQSAKVFHQWVARLPEQDRAKVHKDVHEWYSTRLGNSMPTSRPRRGDQARLLRILQNIASRLARPPAKMPRRDKLINTTAEEV